MRSSLVLILFMAGLVEACELSVQPLSFGEYDGLSGAPLEGRGQVSVICPEARPLALSLDGGLSANPFDRWMQGLTGNRRLHYNLFADSARSLIWADGNGGSYRLETVAQRLDAVVYGWIAGGQAVAPGVYRDVVTVTLAY